MTNKEWDNRINCYLDILSESPQIRSAILNVKKQTYLRTGKQLAVDQQLYLVAIVPSLIGFVQHVIKQAVATGKNRLYFLSRDGYQMYRIAKVLCKNNNISIDCRYLYVSRLSMRVPGYHMDLAKSIDSICVAGIDVTLRKILRRALLLDSEIDAVIHELKLEENADTILNYQQIMSLKQQLRQSKLLYGYIEDHSKDAYEEACLYLKQEGLCKDDKYALVDSGWIGTLQCSIEKLVQSVNSNINVEGYYFGLYEYPSEESKNRFHGYYFTPENGLRKKSRFSNSLFETIVSSEEGMTLGYLSDEVDSIPIIYSKPNPNREQMKKNIETLDRLLANLQISIEKISITGKTIQRLFDEFMAKPSKTEVMAYGDNLFCDDVMDDGQKKVAAELTWEQIHNLRFLRKLMIVIKLRKATIYESAWIEGSITRYIEKQESQVRRELRYVRRYKWLTFLRKRLRRI